MIEIKTSSGILYTAFLFVQWIAITYLIFSGIVDRKETRQAIERIEAKLEGK